jgi:hypothetical protein
MVRLCHCGCPALLECWWSNNLAEEDPLYNAQWRPPNRPPYAHHPLRDAEQVETTEEAHVLLLRSLPQARCTRKAATGVDFGLVGDDTRNKQESREANYHKAMPFVSIYRRRMNMYGATHCDSCRHLQSVPGSWLTTYSTKLRDAELVEPLLRKLPAGLSTMSIC